MESKFGAVPDWNIAHLTEFFVIFPFKLFLPFYAYLLFYLLSISNLIKKPLSEYDFSFGHIYTTFPVSFYCMAYYFFGLSSQYFLRLLL